MWDVWSLPSLLLIEYIPEQKGKASDMLPQKHVNLRWVKALKREFGRRTWVAKSKKLFTLSFLCKYLSTLYGFHKWDNMPQI